MALKSNIDMRDVASFLNQKHDELEDKAYQTLIYVGESFIKNARKMTKTEGGFGDVTGNLRSSIGYVIFKDGKPIHSVFRRSSKGSDRGTGMFVGENFAKDLPITVKRGLQLVGVAGMKYAAHVENRGLNVISYQADIALVDLSEMVRKIRLK